MSYSRLERFIKPADKRLLRFSTTSVECDHMIALGQEGQAPRFVEPVTGQMEGRVVAGATDALEEIEIEILTSHRQRDVRRVLLNAAAMRRYHGDRGCTRTL